MIAIAWLGQLLVDGWDQVHGIISEYQLAFVSGQQ